MKIFATIITVFLSLPSFGLVPLESILLGDLSEKYLNNLESIDPISYIFVDKNITENKNEDDYKRKLALYRGHILEGENLSNRCSHSAKLQYPTYWNDVQARRSIISTLQYIGLDVTTRALAKYGQYFEFSDIDYSNMVDNLVGNYCSSNLSVISIKHLKRSMLSQFKSTDLKFELPSIDGNPFFPQSLKTINIVDDIRKQEFAVTAKLFRALCSWGGDYEDLRLLVPIVNNPVIMSFVFRSIMGKELYWDRDDNSIRFRHSDNYVAVVCENLICRKMEHDKFLRTFPKSMGHKSFDDDLERAYCTYFKKTKFKTQKQITKIKKIIDSESEEDHIFLVSQFLALVSGVPDFFIALNKWSDGEKIMRSSMDDAWNKWAIERTREFSRDLMFEEQLTIEKVDRKLYFDMHNPKFGVEFDVNLGEFDRINQMIGKLNADFVIKIPKNYLSVIRSNWGKLAPSDFDARKKIIDNFKLQIDKHIEKVRTMFSLPLWNGDMGHLIALELLEQLVKYKGDYFKYASTGNEDIKISLNFAPFALKYLNYKFNIAKEKKRIERDRLSLIAK